MLGLRRFQGTQIDIWQGDIEKFAVDDTAAAPSESAFEAWQTLFRDLDIATVPDRHVSISVTSPSSAGDALAALKSILKDRNGSGRAGFRRLTFVAGNTPIYESLQSALFSTFEDEADGTSH